MIVALTFDVRGERVTYVFDAQVQTASDQQVMYDDDGLRVEGGALRLDVTIPMERERAMQVANDLVHAAYGKP